MSKRFRVTIIAIMLAVVLAAAAVAIGATSSSPASQNTAPMHVGCVLSPSQEAVAKQLISTGHSLTPQQIDALCK